MTDRRSISAKLGIMAAAMAAVLLGTSLVAAERPAAAVVGSDFQPGNIISDAVFYNADAMNETQVQAFLDARLPSCDPGYTCLNRYVEDTASLPARVEGCRAYTGGRRSAAQIIVSVGQACGINPQALITLLQKEQGLVTDPSPSSRQYRSATGYGCPDTADCDALYYGFFNQVYNAAYQFKKYQYSPNGRRYVAGRVNAIQWHPNASCGSSSVYIENQATAGLYLYTPYRPNQAALDNLYGTGDACSSYGNRNFWRQFNDWFGSTHNGSNLIKSSNSDTVWLVVGTTKHAVRDFGLYSDLVNLGPLGIVSQGYLDRLSTGPDLSRLIGDSSGRLFLLDRNSRRHFTSCAQVADFGYNCSNHVVVGPAQLAKLPESGPMSNAVRSTDGHIYWVSAGTRTQAVDVETLRAAGHSEELVEIADRALENLSFRPPLMGGDALVQRGSDPAGMLYYDGAGLGIDAPTWTTVPALKSLAPERRLEPRSFDLVRNRGTMAPVLSDSQGAGFALVPTGRMRVAADALPATVPRTQLPGRFTQKLPVVAGTLTASTAVKSPAGPEVYVLEGQRKRAVAEWMDLQAYRADATPAAIVDVAASLLGQVPDGPAIIRPGSIVSAVDSAQVYLIDGDTRRYVSSLPLMGSFTDGPPRRLPAGLVSSLPTTSDATATVRCAAADQLAVSGALYVSSRDMNARYGLSTFTPLDPRTCALLPRASIGLGPFLADSSGAIFLVENGRRRHVTDYATFQALGGTVERLVPSDARLVETLRIDTPAVGTASQTRPEFLVSSSGQTVFHIVDGTRRALATWSDYERASATAKDARIYRVSDLTLSMLPVAG